MNFLMHIGISGVIFAILANGFKFFVKLRGNIDFSYIAVVIVASYTSALCNIHLHIGLLGSICISFGAAILCTLLVLFLSSKLNDLYFSIGTLTLYILSYQLAYNLEPITGGALGLSGIKRNLIGNYMINGLSPFLLTSGSIAVILFVGIMIFRRSYFYKTLVGRGENEAVTKSLGVPINRYKFVMILLTSLFAVVGGNLFTFYYLYIDPSTFWLSMLILLIIIVFVSYKRNDWGTLLVSILTMGTYEYLRFFKIVDPSKIGYVREGIFALIIIIVSFISFRHTKFGREQ